MEHLNHLRAYHFIAGILAIQQHDLFCGQCSAWNNTLNNTREAMKQFEADYLSGHVSFSPEAAALLIEAQRRLAGLANAANPAGQKKCGNCKLPAGVCFVKSSRSLLEKV